MNISDIKNILTLSLKIKDIYIKNNNNHFEIIVISNQFIGISLIQRHQLIYTPLMKYIKNNSIHAISIKTYSVEEWEKNNYKLNNKIAF